MAGELAGRNALASDLLDPLHCVGERDLLRADPDLDFRSVFCDQRMELLEQVFSKVAWLSDRRLIDARTLKFGVGPACAGRRIDAVVDDAQERIAKGLPLLLGGWHTRREIAIEGADQRGRGPVV